MVLSARARSGTLPLALALIALLGLAGLLPLDSPAIYLLTLAMSWAVAAVGLDLFSGYLGQSSFGHAAFMAIGAYGAAILRTDAHVATLPAVILAIVIAVAIAAVIGLALVQLKHFGAALTTFFFALVVVVMLSGDLLDPIAHSTNGVVVPPLELPDFIDAHVALFWLAWILLLVTTIVTSNYANSRSGRALRLIKQNEVVAATMGIRVKPAKHIAFLYSAAIASVAGFPISAAIGFLAPETFSPTESITLFAMAAVGGLGSLAGPIFGALFFTLTPQFLQVAGSTKAIIFAAILLAALIFLPEGVFGGVEQFASRFPAVRQAPRQWYRRIRPASAPRPAAPVGARSAKVVDSSQPDLLRVEGVSVRYGGIVALRSADLVVRRGDTHALIGPNGAGKTTLLNCISGVQRFADGRILFNADLLARGGAVAARRRGIARTFQHPSLVPDLNAIDNVKLGLYATVRWSLARDLLGPVATRRREAAVAAAAGAALRRVGFDPARDGVLGKDLTLAENRIVDIGRAIASDADLLLLDEPTAGLSEHEIESVVAALKAVRKTGITVLLVAHDVKFVIKVADRITVLDRGAILADGLPEVVIRDPRVVDAYLGVPVAVSA